MAKFSSSAFSVLMADGISLLAAKVKGVTYGDESITEQTDGLGDDHEEHTPVGMSRATFTQTGALFDDATDGMHLAFRANTDPSRILSFAAFGNTIGATFTGALGALKTKYEVLVNVGALTKANAAYQIDGAIEDGVILQTHVQQTIDWTNAAVDNGAASSAGGSAFLQVSQLAGITGFVGYVEDSADGSSGWAVIGTFSNITAAPAAQRITIAGTIRRWTRFRGDATGTGTITPFVGLTRFTA